MRDSEGEKLFFDTKIKNKVNVIFDVGALWSDYPEYECEVHYFDPVVSSIIELKKTIPNNNTLSVYNSFGLGDEEKNLKYFNHGAFFNRPSLGDGRNVLVGEFPIKRGDNYMSENNISYIDYLKIDVEGFELHVLKGFGDMLDKVKFIQFEYGIGLRDAGYTLLDIVSYLRGYGFNVFGKIQENGELNIIDDYSDNWDWCNIVCYNENVEV